MGVVAVQGRGWTLMRGDGSSEVGGMPGVGQPQLMAEVIKLAVEFVGGQ